MTSHPKRGRLSVVLAGMALVTTVVRVGGFTIGQSFLPTEYPPLSVVNIFFDGDAVDFYSLRRTP